MALLLAVKLLSGLIEHREMPDSRSAVLPESVLAFPSPGQPDLTEIAFASRTPDGADDPATLQRRPHGPAVSGTAGLARSPDTTDLPAAAAALIPAARLARDELHRDGHALTRDALAARLRRHGHPIRNASLTALLHNLRQERAPASTDRQEPANRAA